MYRITCKIVLVAVCFALFVVTLGAYTRLTDAGLGCPDWPTCYGHMILPEKGQAYAKAQSSYPDSPIEKSKAWTEMAHRYAAGTLGLFILFIAFQAIRARINQHKFPRVMPFVLVGLLVFQAVLGMWTVTLKLLPIVVMGHLLGGMSILAGLWWCYLSLKQQHQNVLSIERFKPWIILGCVIVFCQIALGGWVSANYAGISCVGFPSCNGTLLPHLDLAKAFDLSAQVGENYQGGLLDATTRVTIQFIHRLGALLTFVYVLGLTLCLMIKTQGATRKVAFIALSLVMLQFTLGIINVIYLLPLKVAVAHNGVAAILLLSMLALLNQTRSKHGGFHAY